MKDLMAVLMLDPGNLSSRALFAKLLKTIGEFEKAEHQILQTISFEPDQGLHYAELGDIRYQMNQKNKLLEAITGNYQQLKKFCGFFI